MRKNRFFFLLFLVVYFGWSAHSFAQKADKIVAIVNDDVITEAELVLFASMTDLDSEAGAPGNNAGELRKKLLQRMVEDKLVLQEAKKMNIAVNEKLVEDRIDEIKEKAGSSEAFDEALEQQGITLNELREKLKNQLLVYLAIQRRVTDAIQVSPKEVTDFYNAHTDNFMTPETVVVDSIFVDNKEMLDKVKGELESGKDFQKIAETYSRRGSLGSVKRGQLKKDLDDFIFGLEPQEYSRPFEYEGGYYVFLVKEKKPPSSKSIDEVKGQISTILQNEKTERKLKEWIEELKDKAYISIRE